MSNQQTSETGSLILIHNHNNFELLQLFTDVSNKLYYKGSPVCPINDPDLLNLITDENGILQYNGKPIMIPVKDDENNALKITSSNELFVDGTYFLTQEQYEVLSKFRYGAYLLTFNGREVALKADDNTVKNIINQVWNNIDNDSNYDWLEPNGGGATS